MASSPLEHFRKLLKTGRAELSAAFEQQVPIATLVAQHTTLIDGLLSAAWLELKLPIQGLALIAVGGYGRSELLPHSDIDLLILIEENLAPATLEAIAQFITLAWDLGLDLGHSVRTLTETKTAAQADITIITNLLEARFLQGDAELFAELNIRPLWTDEAFFKAKVSEQMQRYQKYSNALYELEPNIKNSPGGLRDLQTIVWVAKWHFGGNTLPDLVDRGFLTAAEFKILQESQHFLWRVRWALHRAAERAEERLLFDYQVAIAAQFGYQDKPGHKGIEQFMQDYYRCVLELRALNDMLLQLFREAIIESQHPPLIEELNPRFRVHNHYIETTNDQVFTQTPSALLEIFILMCEHPSIKGVRAQTIRLIRAHTYLIDDNFRQDPSNRAFFISLLRQPCDISPYLRRLARYGLLARYLPQFGRVTGQMQYDLYHVYTVDQHTLTVVANICLYRQPNYQDLPFCGRMMARIPKPELLLIAALFHDIGKGSGRDHSEFGAELVRDFCQDHGLNAYDTSIVVWLVHDHLLMSNTAQRKEITNPEVVNEFAKQVGDQLHLDLIYLLTVADICGTNPKLWNSWRAALLEQLYDATRRALPRLNDNPINKTEIITQVQTEALNLLLKQEFIEQTKITELWAHLGEDYFLSDSPAHIAKRTQLILAHGQQTKPLIVVSPHHTQGSTEIFIYMPDQNYLFATCAAVLDQLGLNILEARIMTAKSGYTLDTFVVLDREDKPVTDTHKIKQIIQKLEQALKPGMPIPAPAKRRLDQQIKHFLTPTEVFFDNSYSPDFTILLVICPDHPGVLARLGAALVACQIRVLQAKIVTIGERVEDVFFITDIAHQALLGTEQQAVLREKIVQKLR